MKEIRITYKDKPVVVFRVETDDFQEIIEMLYMKYKDAIGFEIKSIDKENKVRRVL